MFLCLFVFVTEENGGKVSQNPQNADLLFATDYETPDVKKYFSFSLLPREIPCPTDIFSPWAESLPATRELHFCSFPQNSSTSPFQTTSW